MFNRKICRWNFFVIKIYQFEFWRRWNSIHKINLWWQALTVNYLLSDWNIFHLNLRMKTISFSSTRTTNAWKITIFVFVARLNRPKRFCEWLLGTFSRNSEQCWKKDFRWVILIFCFLGSTYVHDREDLRWVFRFPLCICCFQTAYNIENGIPLICSRYLFRNS